MVDIALVTTSLLPALHKALPYLLNLGGKAVEEAAKHLGGDAWDTAKEAWEKIRGKHPTLEAAAQETAEDPGNETAKQLFDLQFFRAMQKDSALAKDLSDILKNYQSEVKGNTLINGTQHNTMNLNKVNINGPVIAHSQIHGNIDMSINKSPTVQELEKKEEKKKILDILSKFDRKAINDQMHEENLAFMTVSLNELRIDLQRMGSSTVADPEIKLLFGLMKTDIEKIIILTKFIHQKGQPQGWDASIFDLRSFGMLPSASNIYDYYNQSAGEEWYRRIYQFVYGRLHRKYKHAKNIDYGKVPSNWTEMLKVAADRGLEPTGIDEVIIKELSANIPLNIEALSGDASILYLFGMIDQLKESIMTKAGSIRQKVVQMN